MKLLLPFALVAAMWAVCGNLGEKKESRPSDDRPAASNQSAKPALDREAVKKELVTLANDILNASKDGDVTFLAKITTDDFKFIDIDGKVRDKNKTLAEVKEEKAIKSAEITDERLVNLDESSAVLSYTLKVVAKNGRSAKAWVTDDYVRENGEWLIRREQQTLLK